MRRNGCEVNVCGLTCGKKRERKRERTFNWPVGPTLCFRCFELKLGDVALRTRPVQYQGGVSGHLAIYGWTDELVVGVSEY